MYRTTESGVVKGKLAKRGLCKVTTVVQIKFRTLDLAESAINSSGSLYH